MVKPRTVTTVKDPAVAQAEKLWKALQDSWGMTEQNITNIIRSRAWEPLGYESFEKAWVDKMSNITLAVELQPHVVYALFDEGLTPDEVCDVTKGIGPDQAETLKRQKDSGVPANKATTLGKKKPTNPNSTTVREHDRKVPYEPASHVRFEVPASELKLWVQVAKKAGKTVPDIALEATRSAIQQLMK